ncbi:hypothetical protein PISL3812_05476 [Talaromyces islandicus]|uniref:C2H2-type domain-containing protein n=1 Tax=Talaromyces islandicus TaxID=28573 RepID=A0A0U1LZU8_TALIS|nr:hypothetical protein PISL3812_05476 [Talaromyces islandicus]
MKLEKNTNCKQCGVAFEKQAEFDKHQKSGLRNRTRDKMQCISEMCRRRFKSLSAVISHLQQGRCASGMTRQKINKLIQKHDTDGLIMEVSADDSVSSVTEDGSSMMWDVITTPSTGPTLPLNSEECDGWDAIIASRPWSSISYAGSEDALILPSTLGAHVYSADDTIIPVFCPLCPSKVRQLTSMSALQDHISSTAHEKRMFHCPKSPESKKDNTKKTKSFASLGGLLAHLEAGVCQGGIGVFFETVKYLEIPLRDIGFDEKLLKLYSNL